MKVIDILQLTCAYLNCYSDYQLYFKPLSIQTPEDETQVTLPEDKSEILEFLLLSLNNTLEILLKKIPLITTHVLELTSNKINFSQLEKKLNNIVVIKQNNKKINFEVLDNYILITNPNFTGGSVEVTYSYYLPKVTELNEEISINVLSKKQTLALGVASEFCFIQGLFDDAEIWQNRFNKELENDCNEVLSPKPFKNFIMPKRNWR